MKKILFAIAFVMMMVIGANAQTDGFFTKSFDEGYSNRLDENSLPGIGFDHLDTNDQNGGAPLGTGLLILTALGAGYALKRKREE